MESTISAIVDVLNNVADSGGYWLPNIQRKFVWEPLQIERLFDSVMRKYPIGSLLVWKTKSPIRYRKFVQHYGSSNRFDKGEKGNSNLKCLVLDGQQRLQSFFIGLKGSYRGKVLCFNVMSGQTLTADEMLYEFKFKNPDKVEFPFKPVNELLRLDIDDPYAICDQVIPGGVVLAEEETKTVTRNISRLVRAFTADKAVVYQLLDGTVEKTPYDDEAIVEIFIRANSGGTQLNKSDLLFSLLTSDWDEFEEKVEELRSKLNGDIYNFNRDYILKTALVLLDKKAQYQVAKFREKDVREGIRKNWKKMAEAMMDVRDFMHDKTYLRTDKAIPSYMCLIPLIYFRYHWPKKWKLSKGKAEYIVRSMLCGSFSFASDTGVDQVVDEISKLKDFNLDIVLARLQQNGRAIKIDPKRLFESRYGSKTVHLMFNLWYSSFNYAPAYRNNTPQADHIFAQTILDKVEATNAAGRKVKRYPKKVQDQLANLMLLKQGENGPSGKGKKALDEWLKGKSKKYLELHLIPTDPSLWKAAKFEKFIEARKMLIQKKFAKYLSEVGANESRD